MVYKNNFKNSYYTHIKRNDRIKAIHLRWKQECINIQMTNRRVNVQHGKEKEDDVTSKKDDKKSTTDRLQKLKDWKEKRKLLKEQEN